MSKKTIGIVLTLLGLFMLSYGVIVSGAFTSNNTNKDKNKEEKEETLKTIGENIVLYDENNIKVILNKLTKFKYEDVYYFEMDASFENNNSEQKSAFIFLRANDLNNNIASVGKIMKANEKDSRKDHSYDSYLKEFNIDDFYNVHLDIEVMDSMTGEIIKKTYKFEDTYIKENKEIGTVLFSNDEIEVRTLDIFSNYTDYPKKRVLPIIIKNKDDTSNSYNIINNKIKVDGEEVECSIGGVISPNESALTEFVFATEKDKDSINKIEFQLTKIPKGPEDKKLITDVITYNNKKGDK